MSQLAARIKSGAILRDTLCCLDRAEEDATTTTVILPQKRFKGSKRSINGMSTVWFFGESGVQSGR